jgi:hypothetical protein
MNLFGWYGVSTSRYEILDFTARFFTERLDLRPVVINILDLSRNGPVRSGWWRMGLLHSVLRGSFGQIFHKGKYWVLVLGDNLLSTLKS